MKKAIALITTALMLMSFAASAAEITGIEKDIAGAAVTVKGSGYAAGEKVSMRILYPNVETVADGKQTGTIAWWGNATADEAGNITITAGMPADTNKQIVEFALDITDASGNKMTKVLKWMDNGGLIETVSNIKNATSADVAMNEIIAKADALEIIFITPWNSFNEVQKGNVAAAVYKIRKSFNDFNDVIAEVDYNILQEALKSAQLQTEFFGLLDTYNNMLDAALFDETYNGMNNVIKGDFEAKLFNMRSRLDGSCDTFKYTFKEAVLTAEIAKLDRNAPLIKVLNDYADVLINKDSSMTAVMNSFKTVTEEKQLEVCDALLEARTSNLTDICNIIKNTMNKKEESSGTSSGISGSGSSGSGKKTGGYSISGAVVTPPADQTEEIKPATVEFSDMSTSHYAYESVRYLTEKGIINGYSENGRSEFRPDADMTREEFVKMVFLAFGFELQQDEYGFTDVASESWYAPYVNTAAKLGIVNGTGDGKFGVGTEITREQMCTVIYRIALQKQINLVNINNAGAFWDDNSISDYAKEAVKALKAAEIISGDENGNFNPDANATRANAAKVLYGIITLD